MSLFPWRLKSFISDHFPIFYHLVANIGARGNSQEHWDMKLAAGWDSAELSWPTKNELMASLTRPTEAILDVGCGTGHILRTLRDRGYANLHGLEVSEYAIKRLRSEGIQMHRGVLPTIPLPDSTFDVVIASQVLEHIIRARRFLKEVRRVLKPSGRAYIFVPDNCLGPISEREHVAKYNARSLRAIVEPYFEVVSLESIRDANHPMAILFAHVRKASE
jgi:SAM-dependent methyltransferase